MEKSESKNSLVGGKLIGTIYRIIPAKGFCFIRDPDGQSRFGHARSFVNRDFDVAREGQAARYIPATVARPLDEKGKPQDGKRALEIELLPAGFATFSPPEDG